jgi:hypothetical protein
MVGRLMRWHFLVGEFCPGIGPQPHTGLSVPSYARISYGFRKGRFALKRFDDAVEVLKCYKGSVIA